MLTYAIGFVQDVQLICFAIVLTCMALHDRTNRSLRWLACGYLAGLGGAVLEFAGHWLPRWASMGLPMEAPLIGYGCFYLSAAVFVRRGFRASWIWIAMAAAALPFFLYWAVTGQMDRSGTLQDAVLAVETSMTAFVLIVALDRETRWPRRTIAAFFAVYSLVEFWRVGVFLHTGKMPGRIAPGIEVASGIVYVVSCSVLPLAFIWMMNSRLLVHLSRLTMLDPLTELLNRRGLRAATEHELARYMRTGADLAVVVLDLDHFKAVNDRFGHDFGDMVLSGVSALLRKMVRETDIVGRIGGEEFTILLPGTSRQDAWTVVERLRTAVEQQVFHLRNREARVTASFGITLSEGRSALTWESLQHEADLALYMAKHAGRNIAKFFGENLSSSESDASTANREPAGRGRDQE